MGEGTAIGLQGIGRATLVGTRMAGLAGAIYDVTLPVTGWTVALLVESLFRVDGTPREAVVPDVEVDLTVATGDDPVLDAGLRWLSAPSQPAATAASRGRSRQSESG
ncbi:MAG: hypothetical protein K0V04_37665 [Deltaproteobacteria bacterium]|nr:hypothetical protein [Deltaproteobacteria bacterium]